MTGSPHTFDRLAFELELRGREHVTTLQNRVSAFAAGSLQGVLTDCLQPLAAQRNVVVVEKVVLDLGEVSWQSLEDDLEAGILRHLGEWVMQTRWHHSEPEQKETENSKDISRPPFCLRKPNRVADRDQLPANRPQNLALGNVSGAVALARNGSGEWPQLACLIRDSRVFRGRLVCEVSSEHLHSALQSIVPGHSRTMADLAASLVSWHDHRPLATVDRNAFRRTVWECILHAAAQCDPSIITVRTLVADVLRPLAARYSKPCPALAAEIALRLREPQPEIPPGSSEAELETRRRFSAVPVRDVATLRSSPEKSKLQSPLERTLIAQTSLLRTSLSQTSTSASGRQLEDFAQFLEWGTFPGNSFWRSGGAVEADLRNLIAVSPDRVATLIRRLAESPSVKKRIACEFSEQGLHLVLGVLDPANAAFVVTCMRSLRRLHAEKPLARMSNTAFAQALREISLEHLVESPESAFRAHAFLKYLLRRLVSFANAGYEVLLAQLALRRLPGPRAPESAKSAGQQNAVEAAILALLDEELGIVEGTPPLTQAPAVSDIESDLDSLAQWLQQRNSSFAATGASSGVAVRWCEPACDLAPAQKAMDSSNFSETTMLARQRRPAAQMSHVDPTPGEQIERWLLHGVWPAALTQSESQSESLEHWLASQPGDAWQLALRHVGAQEHVFQRLVLHVPFSFLLKITNVAAAESELAVRYLDRLQAAGQRVEPGLVQSWEAQARRYAFAYLLQTVSSSGREISVRGLARYTLHALSLRRQVPYERLLLSVEQESRGQESLQILWRDLREELCRVSSEQAARLDWVSSADRVGGVEIILHFLQHASLPEGGEDISFSTLRRMAERLPSDQMDAIVRSSSSWIAAGKDTAERIAALLPCSSSARPLDAAKSRTALSALPQSALLSFDGHSFDSHSSGDRCVDDPGFDDPGFDDPGFENRCFGDLSFDNRALDSGRLDDFAPGVDHAEAELRAFASFLKTGSVPWWADAMVRQPSGRWLGALLQHQPQLVLDALRAVADNSRAMLRLLRYVPQPELAGIIMQAEPNCGGFVLLYIRAGSQLTEHAALTAAQQSQASTLHWLESLQFVLQENGAAASCLEFLRLVIRRVSQKLDLALGRYVRCLLEVSEHRMVDKSGYKVLAELLNAVHPAGSHESGEEQHQTGAEIAPSTATAAGVSQSTLEANGVVSHESRSSEDSKVQSSPAVRAPCFPDRSNRLGQIEALVRYGELSPGVEGETLSQFWDAVAREAPSRPLDYRRCLQQHIGEEMERKRMACRFPSSFFPHLWPLLFPTDYKRAVLCLDRLRASASSVIAEIHHEQIRRICLEELLRIATDSSSRRFQADAYVRAVFRRLQQEFSFSAVSFFERMRESSPAQSGKVPAELAPIIDRVERVTAVIPPFPQPHSNTPQPQPNRPAKIAAPLPADQPFYVGNAGAVLLWPFLTLYFKTLGLLTEGSQFRSEAERSRGIHLVQYLATGGFEAPEYELLLNKILCGGIVEQPLDAVSRMTEPEDRLSAQLLQSLIANWKKLGNTSIEGLRNSFLIREGRLTRKKADDSWSLVVSTKGYDVLLDSLPWRLSMIRLPWMKNLLYVKWR